MHRVYRKSHQALSWLLAFLMLGIGVGVTTFAGWFAIALLAAVPTAVMVCVWRGSAPMTSRPVQEAR